MAHCLKAYQYFLFEKRSWNTAYLMRTYIFISKVFTYIFKIVQFLWVKRNGLIPICQIRSQDMLFKTRSSMKIIVPQLFAV